MGLPATATATATANSIPFRRRFTWISRGPGAWLTFRSTKRCLAPLHRVPRDAGPMPGTASIALPGRGPPGVATRSAGGLLRGGSRCTGKVCHGGCPVGHCAERGGCGKGIVGTMSNPARPGEREKPACSDAGRWSLPQSLSLASGSGTGLGTGTGSTTELADAPKRPVLRRTRRPPRKPDHALRTTV